MSAARSVLLGSILVCLLLLILQLIWVASSLGLGLALLLALLWGWQFFRPGVAGSLALAGTLGTAAYCLLLNPSAGPWVLLVVGMGIVAWDIGGFLDRIEGSLPEPKEYLRLERAHFRKLAGVILIGLGIGGLSLILRMKIQFAGAVFLAVAWIVGLAGFLRFIRKLDLE